MVKLETIMTPPAMITHLPIAETASFGCQRQGPLAALFNNAQ